MVCKKSEMTAARRYQAPWPVFNRCHPRGFFFGAQIMIKGYRFKCPKCGGYFFGTRQSPDGDIGHCDRINCDFTWKRSEDEKVYTEPVAEYFEKRYKELIDDTCKQLWLDVYVAVAGSGNVTDKSVPVAWADSAVEEYNKRF
jgi:ssDNA-binding Zn-finger/Zn-ribbon topoisomerase 1